MKTESQLPDTSNGIAARILDCAALIGLVLLAAYSCIFVDAGDTLDLKIYLDSAERLRNGLSLYEVRYSFPDRATDFDLQYLYPPALAALLSLVSFIPRPTLITLWQCGLVVSIVISALLLARIVRLSTVASDIRPRASGLFLLLALWPPTLDGILWGQVNAYILVLLVCGVYCVALGSDTAAGAALGMAAALKGTPILLVIPLLVHRRWRAAAAMGGAVVAAHLPLLAVPHGVRAVAEFFKTSQEIAAGNVVNDPFYDYSLRRVIALCADVSPTFLSLISVVVVCGYVAVTVLQKSRYRVSGDGLSLLCCVQVLCAIPVMMIVSPLIWFHHVVWLFPVLVALWSFGGSCYTRFCARASYLCIAPLLYLHVYTRNFTDMSVWYIKAIPLLVIGSCGVTLTLVIFRRWQDSELA